MVPRPVGRGGDAGHNSTARQASLQWCRVLLDAEGAACLEGGPHVGLLQWCRVLLDAEGSPSAADSPHARAMDRLQWCRVLLDAEGGPKPAAGY